MAVYELGESRGWYDGGGFLGLGDSPFAKVLENNFKISELISNVAPSITKYAQLMIPDKWDKEGKAISFHPMTVKEFEDKNNALIHLVFDGQKMCFPADDLNLKEMCVTYDIYQQ